MNLQSFIEVATKTRLRSCKEKLWSFLHPTTIGDCLRRLQDPDHAGFIDRVEATNRLRRAHDEARRSREQVRTQPNLWRDTTNPLPSMLAAISNTPPPVATRIGEWDQGLGPPQIPLTVTRTTTPQSTKGRGKGLPTVNKGKGVWPSLAHAIVNDGCGNFANKFLENRRVFEPHSRPKLFL